MLRLWLICMCIKASVGGFVLAKVGQNILVIMIRTSCSFQRLLMSEFKDKDNSREIETKKCSCDDKEVTHTYNRIIFIILLGLTKYVCTKSDFSHVIVF